jgi:hypothetical protein
MTQIYRQSFSLSFSSALCDNCYAIHTGNQLCTTDAVPQGKLRRSAMCQTVCYPLDDRRLQKCTYGFLLAQNRYDKMAGNGCGLCTRGTGNLYTTVRSIVHIEATCMIICSVVSAQTLSSRVQRAKP